MNTTERAVSKSRLEYWLSDGTTADDQTAGASAGAASRPPSPLEHPEGATLADVLSTSVDPWDAAAVDHLSSAQMDALLVLLRKLSRRLDRPVAQIAAVFVEARAWRALGHARQEDFSRTRLQRSGRWLRLTAALGRALRRFPALDAAFTGKDGGAPLGKSAVVEIAAVATENNVARWIERARQVSFRQLVKDVQLARNRQGGAEESESLEESGSDGSPPPWEGPSKEDAQPEAGGAATRAEASSVDVVIECPPEVVVAFDEVLDLHRAVSGREVSTQSFVEALVAEDGAGEHGPAEPTEEIERHAIRARTLRDPDERCLRPGQAKWMDDTDPEERALRCRRAGHPAAPVLRDVTRITADVFLLELAAAKAAAGPSARDGTESGDSSQADAHELTDHLLAAGMIDATIERATAQLLAALQRKRPWGYSGAPKILRFENDAPTWANGLVQYAEERLELSGSRARQLARVAQRLRAFPVLQHDWLQGRLATDKVLALLPLLRAASIPIEQQRTWSEHARTITVRRLEDEVRELKRRTPRMRRAAPPPPPLPDEEWHASLFRSPGRTQDRVTELAAQLEANPGPSSDVLRLVLPRELGMQLMAAIHRARDRQSGEPARPYWYGLLQLLLDYARTWDPPAEAGQRRPEHADIYEREGYRCMAPGCSGRCHLEAHHLEHRAQGGSDEPANLVTLCAFHHRQGVHGFVMEAEGPAPTQTRFTLGRGRHALTFQSDKACPEPVDESTTSSDSGRSRTPAPRPRPRSRASRP